MSYLYIYFNLNNNGFSGIVFFLSLLSILFAISVFLNKNPIISIFFLIALFTSISLNLIILGYNFLGLSYLLVYVGAVSILFLFIIMLLNIRISELLNDTRNSIPLVIFTSMVLSLLMFEDIRKYIYILISKYNKLHYVISNSWDNNLISLTDISCVGNTMYTTYSILLIISSFILLLAMIGAIVITKKESIENI